MATAVVLYESMFGDAEKIARAIADGLREHLDTDVVAAKEAPLGLGEEAVFILVDDRGVQLVSESAILAESDVTAQDLRAARARPVVTVAKVGAEAEKRPATPPARTGVKHVKGTVVAVEYGPKNTALWIGDGDGKRQRVLLGDDELSRNVRSVLREREKVDAVVDDAGTMVSIRVDLQ
jgi:hypothetical protein